MAFEPLPPIKTSIPARKTTAGGDDILFNSGAVKSPYKPINPNYVGPYSGFNANDPSTFGDAGKTPETPGFSFFNRNNGLIPGLEALGNIVNAYTGLKQLGLAEETFDFNKNLTRSNLANQAQVTNAAIKDRVRAAAVQQGVEGDALDEIVTRQYNERKIRGTL